MHRKSEKLLKKNNFWDAVYDLMVDIKKNEIVAFGGDLNGHVEIQGNQKSSVRF